MGLLSLTVHGVSTRRLVVRARLAAVHPPFVYYIMLTGVPGARAAVDVDPVRLAAIRTAAGAPVVGARRRDDSLSHHAAQRGIVL